MGSAGFIVYDDTRNIVDVAYRLSMFLHVESCGQCNPCKTGTQAITAALERIVAGRGDDAAIDAIHSRLRTVTDASRCYLPTQEQRLVASVFEHFPADVEERLRGYRGDLDIPIPKIADIADGVALLDEQADRKRPDWTYAETVVRLG
jgi:NADH-quinone oxidoreductase subunit F